MVKRVDHLLTPTDEFLKCGHIAAAASTDPAQFLITPLHAVSILTDIRLTVLLNKAYR
ncbi:MAG TPA: hypothetical protein VMV72_12215 [Verrucomicrobiae bacterium]|nr:hypothetical protein [Verrucomicrobiae bacterium]